MDHSCILFPLTNVLRFRENGVVIASFPLFSQLACFLLLFQWKTRTASFDSQGSCPSPKAPASP